MATFKQGILGGFSGKVGPVIGSSWKGKAVMRAIALSHNDPNTEPQQQQRAKFGLVSKFISAVIGFVGVGFKSQANGITEANAAMKANLPAMIGGSWPNYTLDFTKAVLAKGSVDLPYNPSASLTGTDLDLTWIDNSGLGNALSTDLVMVVAYNTSKKQAVYSTDLAARSARSASFGLPSQWTGDSVEVFLAAHRAVGSESSNSVYLGNYTI